MKTGDELDNLIIVSALDQVYTEHRGLDTYEELCNDVLSEADLLWEPFEHHVFADSVLELVENQIDVFKIFLKRVQE